MVLCWTKDGELPQMAMALQAKQVLQCAARRKWGFQEVWTTGPDGAVVEKLRIKNAPGGCIILDTESAGTKLGAGLVLAIERLGAGHKVKLGVING
jgi:hypothetical protein